SQDKLIFVWQCHDLNIEWQAHRIIPHIGKQSPLILIAWIHLLSEHFNITRNNFGDRKTSSWHVKH
ncbi:MAG: hypothetical protein MHPSP_001796, partial [Paramarteilia canceri]